MYPHKHGPFFAGYRDGVGVCTCFSASDCGYDTIVYTNATGETVDDLTNEDTLYNVTSRYVYIRCADYDAVIDQYKETVDCLRILRMIVCSIGAVFNMYSMLILLKIPWRGKPIYKLLLSLAVSDMLIAVLHFVMVFIKVPTIWDFYTNYFNLRPRAYSASPTAAVLCFIYFISQTAALVSMLSLAVQLLIAVKKPLRHRQLLSGRRVNILIICIWMVPAIISLAIGLGEVYIRQKYNVDVLYGFLGQYVTGFSVLLSNISFTVFIVIYLVIYCGIRSAIANFPLQEYKNLKKATVTTLFIIVTYAIYLTPASIGMLMRMFPRASIKYWSVSVFLYVIGESVFVLNTVCDPLIFAVRIREVRETYMGILCQCRRRGHGNIHTRTEETVA